MKTQTQITIIALCLAVMSLQFVACKKETYTSKSASQSTTNASVIPDSALVAWYTFNGNTKDHSGHHNNVIFNSATPTAGRNGLENNAYYFDGFSSYMRVANSKSLNPKKGITLAAVVKPMGFYQGQCHYNRILTKSYDDFSNGRYELAFSDQYYYNFQGCDEVVSPEHEAFYGSYGNGSSASGSWAPNDYIEPGKWYTLVYTCDGAVSNIYINGVLKGTENIPTTFTPNDADLLIGKTLNPSFPYYFTGAIDAIRIYNTALSPQQIQNNFKD